MTSVNYDFAELLGRARSRVTGQNERPLRTLDGDPVACEVTNRMILPLETTWAFAKTHLPT